MVIFKGRGTFTQLKLTKSALMTTREKRERERKREKEGAEDLRETNTFFFA